MQAVRFHEYGSPAVLRNEEAPLPEPGDGEVRVRIIAAGVNPADCQFRRGDYQAFAPRPLPFIPGWDLAGTIDRGGPGATRFDAGAAVFGMADMSRNGAYAEYIVVREDELAPAPASIAPQLAAAVPLAALTAWKALFDSAQLKPGQRALIHAAAGGVGQFAVQLAHRAGAHVVASASAHNHELLRSLGADETLDYRDDMTGLEQSFDAVIDGAGGDTRARSWGVLKTGGIMVCVAMPPPDLSLAGLRGLRAEMVRVKPDGQRLAEIARLIDARELRVTLDREFPLEEASAAHEYVEARHARGKVVLRVRDC